MKILIVEDCEVTTVLIKGLLEQYSPKPSIITAGDGLEGLSKLADEPVDLILSDVMMPKMGGIEFVQEVRKIPKYQATTIIMLTTVSEIKEMQKGKDAGANNWLKKPVDADRLYELLDQHIKSSSSS